MFQPTALPIIHINGYPGVGKRTIARKLGEFVGLRPIDDDLASAVLPYDSVDYQRLRHTIRYTFFNTLVESIDSYGHCYAFTDFLADNEIGRSVMGEYRDLARLRQCNLLSITLTCRKEENMRRLAFPERSEHGKITDREILERIRQDNVLLKGPEDLRNKVIDVSDLTAEEVARVIYFHALIFL
jgi:hypothetical protein